MLVEEDCSYLGGQEAESKVAEPGRKILPSMSHPQNPPPNTKPTVVPYILLLSSVLPGLHEALGVHTDVNQNKAPIGSSISPPTILP